MYNIDWKINKNAYHVGKSIEWFFKLRAKDLDLKLSYVIAVMQTIIIYSIIYLKHIAPISLLNYYFSTIL